MLIFIYLFIVSSGESNFHAFYYIYDGLEHDKRLKEFHLDRELRQRHSYLPSDRQDSKTKQVRFILYTLQYFIIYLLIFC